MRDRDQCRERGGSQVNERARERDLQAHPNLIPRRCPIVLVATIAMKQRNNSNCSLFCKLFRSFHLFPSSIPSLRPVARSHRCAALSACRASVRPAHNVCLQHADSLQSTHTLQRYFAKINQPHHTVYQVCAQTICALVRGKLSLLA